jgi:hypothetical protein
MDGGNGGASHAEGGVGGEGEGGNRDGCHRPRPPRTHTPHRPHPARPSRPPPRAPGARANTREESKRGGGVRGHPPSRPHSLRSGRGRRRGRSLASRPGRVMPSAFSCCRPLLVSSPSVLSASLAHPILSLSCHASVLPSLQVNHLITRPACALFVGGCVCKGPNEKLCLTLID